MSAAKHANAPDTAFHAAQCQMSFRLLDGQSIKLENVDNKVNVHLVEQGIEPYAVAFLGALAVKYFTLPITHKCILFGWDVAPLSAIIMSTFGWCREFVPDD